MGCLTYFRTLVKIRQKGGQAASELQYLDGIDSDSNTRTQRFCDHLQSLRSEV